MADVRTVEPVVRFCAVISRDDELRAAAVDWLAEHWGRPVITSPPLDFHAGGYYQSSMGFDLRKQLVAFDGFPDPAELSRWKLAANQWESEVSADFDLPQPRPLNLDPGYTTQAKLVLATTKDRDHRIYLRDGIFAEVTLTYVGKQWTHHRWSYPTYRSAAVAEFASACRERLRQHLHATKSFRS